MESDPKAMQFLIWKWAWFVLSTSLYVRALVTSLRGRDVGDFARYRRAGSGVAGGALKQRNVSFFVNVCTGWGEGNCYLLSLLH